MINKITKILDIKKISTLIFWIRGGKKFYVFKKGHYSKAKNSKLDLSANLFFNVSHYNNLFSRDGNFCLFENSTFKTFGNKNIFIYSGCKIDVHKNAKLIIGEGTAINECCRIGAKKEIVIGSNCLIGDEVVIQDFDGHKINNKEGIKAIKIEDNCWIGQRCIILKGVTIHRGSIIGAGTIVTKDVPEYSIVVGNPMRVIRQNIRWGA